MIALRSVAADWRHRSAVAALLVIIGLLVVWEHAGAPEPHIDDLGSICLAVVSGLSIVGVFSGPALLGGRGPRRTVLAPTPTVLRLLRISPGPGGTRRACPPSGLSPARSAPARPRLRAGSRPPV